MSKLVHFFLRHNVVLLILNLDMCIVYSIPVTHCLHFVPLTEVYRAVVEGRN